MRLAVSNIAWAAEDDAAATDVLRRHGIDAIECAPTKSFAKPLLATDDEIIAVRETWRARGLEIVALQSLLFSRPDLNMLGPEAIARETGDYLDGIIRIAGLWGARALVFGSPKNRIAAGLDEDTVRSRGLTAFARAAATAAACGTTFCIEANPAQYQCDFILRHREAFDYAQSVDRIGIGMNLDTGILKLNDEDPATVIAECFPRIRHVHISEPYLAPVGEIAGDHPTIARSLQELGYAGAVSVEMRADDDRARNLTQLERACEFLRRYYG